MQHDDFKNFKMDDLFNNLQEFLNEGGEAEETEPFEDEPDSPHQDGEAPEFFDLTKVFEDQVKSKVEDILNLCNDNGVPAQMCFLIRASEENGHYHAVFSTRVSALTSSAAHAMYCLPHPISHMVQIMAGFPLFLLPPTTFEKSEQYDHEDLFTDVIWPKVEELLLLCKDHKLACQWGAVPKVEEDGATHSMALVGGNARVSCPMAAATVIYRLPAVVCREIVSLAKDVGAFGNEHA